MTLKHCNFLGFGEGCGHRNDASDSVLQSFNDAGAATLVIESLQRTCMYMQHIFWLMSPQVWCGLRCPTAQLDDAEGEDVDGGEEGRRVSRPG